MKKILSKTILAIAATSAITACSTVDLYPQEKNRAEVVTINQNRYEKLEVVLTDLETRQNKVIVYNLYQDRLTPQQYNGTIGNRYIDLNLSLESCALCAETDMQIKTTIKTSEIIQATSVKSSTIQAVDIPQIDPIPLVAENEEIIESSPSAEKVAIAPTNPIQPQASMPVQTQAMNQSSKLGVQESLDDGEELITDSVTATKEQENYFKNTVATVQGTSLVRESSPIAETAQPQPTSVTEFTQPEPAKPFVYAGEQVAKDNSMFTSTTHVMQRPLIPKQDQYIDVIYSETNGSSLDTPAPVTVKVRLIQIQALNLNR